MELYAYKYAKKKGYTIPEYEGRPERMAMKDLFDMMAGTSTGSIVAAALTYPKNEINKGGDETPLYWSKEIIEIYSEKGNLIFKRNSIGSIAGTFWLLLFIVTFGLVGYTIGYFNYTDPDIENAIEDFKRDLDN